jgi:hypothetical protein
MVAKSGETSETALTARVFISYSRKDMPFGGVVIVAENFMSKRLSEQRTMMASLSLLQLTSTSSGDTP